jgi:hypothetical protein
MFRFIIAGAALLFATQASALYEYYLVQDTATKECTIVEEKPTRASSIVVGAAVYRTKGDAREAMKLTPDCK